MSEDRNTSAKPCDDCAVGNPIRQVKKQTFAYGAEKDAVNLSAEIPVWECDSCGFAYTDYEGEEARSKAVRNYVG